LGTAGRNKKHLEAQQMLLQWEVLAHNGIVCARAWSAPLAIELGQGLASLFFREQVAIR
jgi:hypothetical protein